MKRQRTEKKRTLGGRGAGKEVEMNIAREIFSRIREALRKSNVADTFVLSEKVREAIRPRILHQLLNIAMESAGRGFTFTVGNIKSDEFRKRLKMIDPRLLYSRILMTLQARWQRVRKVTSNCF